MIEDNELRIAIALEVMGMKHSPKLESLSWEDSDGCTTGLPAYETDVAAAFAMQDKIAEDDELTEAYRDALVKECYPNRFLSSSVCLSILQYNLIFATPMQRCRAALAAIKVKRINKS